MTHKLSEQDVRSSDHAIDHAIDRAIDRVAPTRRPRGPNAGTQRWRDLLFVHWSLPVDAVRAAVPASMELDLWEGQALVGIVPFAMQAVRPSWLPSELAVDFLEANLRTYVIVDGEPGVYFFSLEAESLPAVCAARLGFGLPYHHARMSVDRRADGLFRYESDRHGDGACLRAEWRVGEPLPASTPGSLQFFLLERYLLFVERGGRVWKGQVHHAPYAAFEVEQLAIRETLVTAAGLPKPTGAPFCAHASPGVDVEVFGPWPAGAGAHSG